MTPESIRVPITARLSAGLVQCLDEKQLERFALAVLVLLAIALRLQPILVEPSAVWPDEIFQTTEPAHRLVYGSGLVPWEFQLGVRSWLLPGIIGGLMELSRLAGDGPDYYLPLIAITFAALAATPVICCFLWCRSLLGAGGALLAAATVAVAPELVYFGARTLSETAAGHLLVAALYILQPGYRVESSRRLLLGGALLGLVLVIRVQLAPAVLVTALWTSWRGGREPLVAALVGAGAVLIGAAFLDALTLGSPLASLWRYVLYNLYYGISATFGVEPWNYYLLGELGVWRGASVTLLLLALVGARRLPLLLLLVVVILAVHSAIAHKEYRFIYPAIVLVAVLAGIGLAQMASWASAWLIGRGTPGPTTMLASAILALAWWGLASFQVWDGATLTVLRRNMHDSLAAASFVARGQAPCGIGLYGLAGIDWEDYGGYTYFHRQAPMYWPKDETELTAAAVGFDTLLFRKPLPEALGYTTLRCLGEICIAHRSGGCRSMPAAPLPLPDVLAGATSAPR